MVHSSRSGFSGRLFYLGQRMQSRLFSFIEAWSGTAIGFVVSIILAHIVYPLFGHSFSFMENVWITLIFTVASIIRSYVVRRAFNRLHRMRGGK